MNCSDFVALHHHSDYSKLDGAARVEEAAARVAEMGQVALAITDHGELGGAMQHWQACNKAGIKPIIGVEFYVAPGDRSVKAPVAWGTLEEAGKTRDVPGAYTHLTVLARNPAGLRSLYRLFHEASATGAYRKPRIDRELLARHSDGLAVATGCAGGEVSTRLRIGDAAGGREAAGFLKDVFGEHAYVEVMNHGIPWEADLNRQLVELAGDLGMQVVATNDSHYIHPTDQPVHDALLCLQTGAKLADENRFRFSGGGYHLRSASGMSELFPPEFVVATRAVADTVESYDELFEFNMRMPAGIIPEEYADDSGRYLAVLAHTGLRKKIPNPPQNYIDQLEYELDVIIGMGYADYFVTLADIMELGRSLPRRDGRSGILFGIRGSGAGSLVAHSVGISDLDPIECKLVFERFLNPARTSMPDIDIDFDDRWRTELLRAVAERYGLDRVARIGTYGTIGAKRAIQDAGRVLGVPYPVVDAIKSLLPPPQHGRQPVLEDVDWSGLDGVGQGIIALAQGLQGLTRNAGVHAAGIVISPVPLVDQLPVFVTSGVLGDTEHGGRGTANELPEVLITDYANPNTNPMIDKLGFVKYDFLSLRNLGIVDECLALLPESVPLPTHLSECTDRATFSHLSTGYTLGIFQLDSPGMRGLLRRLQPSTITDLAAVIALYRPGPMGVEAHLKYADRKNGRAGVEYPHPELAGPLATVLGDTYGLIVFQEQVLQVLKIVCGWDYSEAALLFDAMRKKLTEKMAATEPAFREAMARNGYSAECQEVLWNTLVPFADYSFNRAHATWYGVVSYWTAYLKTHYPAQYMAALITSVADNPDKQEQYLREARRMGVAILPPDVNVSGSDWTPREGELRYGLASIKGVGDRAVAALVSGRPYSGIDDFLRRASHRVINAGTLDALCKGGAFDSLHGRAGLLRDLPDLIERANEERVHGNQGQRPLYPTPLTPSPGAVESRQQYRQWEKELLGIELTQDHVRIILPRVLTVEEWRWLWEAVSRNPGNNEAEVSFLGWNVPVIGGVTLDDSLKRSIEALGLTLETR